MFGKNISRDNDICITCLNGESLRSIAHRHNRSVARVQQIVHQGLHWYYHKVGCGRTFSNEYSSLYQASLREFGSKSILESRAIKDQIIPVIRWRQ